MNLGVDVGNTQTVIGLFDDSGLGRRWRLSTEPEATADELWVKLAALLAGDGLAWGEVHDVVVASVVPPLTQAYSDLAAEAVGHAPLVITHESAPALALGYDEPAELGADRIANAIAAIDAYGAPVVVVDFGTATTLDVIDTTGAYLGGAIAPGVQTSAEALFAKAARLSKVDLKAPERVIGRSTAEAVQAGLVLGEATMVDGLVRRVWDELGVETPVVATGGLAPQMAPLCRTVTAVDTDLTLNGLVLLWRDAQRADGSRQTEGARG